MFSCIQVMKVEIWRGLLKWITCGTKSCKKNLYSQPSLSTDFVVPGSACCGYAYRWDFVMVIQHLRFSSSCVSQLAVWISVTGRLHETAPGRCVTNTSSGRMDWYIGGAPACSPTPVEEGCGSSDVAGSTCTRLQHPYLIWWQVPYLASDFSILFHTVMFRQWCVLFQAHCYWYRLMNDICPSTM